MLLNAYLNAHWVVIKMENLNMHGEQNGDRGVQYPKSDGSGSSSDAPTIQKGDRDTAEGFDIASEHHQNKIPQLDRVFAVLRGYCAIGMESKIAEDGRQALEHTRAERMVVYSLGEKDIQTVRVVHAAHGICAANMMDLDAMGISGPEGHSRHIDDWGPI
jgi:hypothetical protein